MQRCKKTLFPLEKSHSFFTFAPRLSYGVMVAQQILVLFV